MDENVNKNIRASEILLIDERGVNLGRVNFRYALNMAIDSNLDLVEVSSGSNGIPVCRIMDFGKWKYEQSKKIKKSRVNSQKQEIKELKFRPNTGDNDLEYRAKQVDQFLQRGCKVKLNVRFKGREQEHMFVTGKILLEKFLKLISIPYCLESSANIEGNSITVIISVKK